MKVTSVSASGYGYIRRAWTSAAAIHSSEATSVGSEFLSLWLFDAVGGGDFGGVGSQGGVGWCRGDGHAGGGAGQSQKGDRLHAQQAGERHGTVRGAHDMSRGQGAHGGQGGRGGGSWGGWLGEGHVEVDRSGQGGCLGCGFGCL